MLQPWYRPAVQAVGHCLQLLDREGEAVDFLDEACGHVASPWIMAQLAELQMQIGRPADALRSLERFAELARLMDRPTRRWLFGRRSDAAYRLGDHAAAAAFARESAEPFFLALADRLENPEIPDRRVRLAVGFVRQHHQHCGPATLSALAGFWDHEVDQLEVGEEICYDGTPDHRERTWAEKNGFITREFTVTWDAALTLLDRGVPFTLTTVETRNAHLQAVIGYDARRGTLLLRDPWLPHEGEVVAEPFLERYRSVGPRGMAMVPRGRAALLEGVELPEAGLYDRLHRMQVALREHDRTAAAAVYEDLSAGSPGHRLVLHARWLLAIYDASATDALPAIVALRQAFPGDVNLQLAEISCLRNLGRRDDRLALYQTACAGPAADPVVRRQYAQELLADARQHPRAAWLARRALRSRPTDAGGVFVLARVAWDAQRREDALQLYRFACCLDDKDEGLAMSYFSSARYFHREEEPLRLLRSRFRRFGSRSSHPARTLHRALWELDRTAEADAVLERMLRLRPDDGDTLLHAARAAGWAGDFDRAGAWLEEARGRCHAVDWLRAAANLASNRGDLAAALRTWRQVLEAEPAALDANRAIARLLADTEGRPAAISHLEQACSRSPHNYSLHRALIDWLRDENPAAAEPAVRRLLEIHPADAWGVRELAGLLSEQGRHDEAVLLLETARELEPASTREASVRGFVLERAGRHDEARAAYREAIRRDVDNEYAIGRLIETAAWHAQRMEALDLVLAELERQVTYGSGLLAFAQRARGTLGGDVLLATLVRAHESRPDLWHAWSAVINERLARKEHEEAERLAGAALERFPLLPRLWLDLAAVRAARGDRRGEREALERALQISPGWSTAVRALAESLEHDGNYAGSRTVLERAIARDALDAYNHGCLADALWHLGEQEPALDALDPRTAARSRLLLGLARPGSVVLRGAEARATGRACPRARAGAVWRWPCLDGAGTRPGEAGRPRGAACRARPGGRNRSPRDRPTRPQGAAPGRGGTVRRGRLRLPAPLVGRPPTRLPPEPCRLGPGTARHAGRGQRTDPHGPGREPAVRPGMAAARGVVARSWRARFLPGSGRCPDSTRSWRCSGPWLPGRCPAPQGRPGGRQGQLPPRLQARSRL